jgi:aldose 1-epimerase
MIELCEGPLRLTIEPRMGAGLSSLALEGRRGWADVLRPAREPSQFTDLSMYLMAPWTNRIARARFEFGGRAYQLRADWPDGTAIHGDVKDRAWRMLDRTPVSARLALESSEVLDANWPWRYRAEVRYEIEGTSLNVDLGVQNLGNAPMPAGLGFHPFFMRRLWDGDEVRVRITTGGHYSARHMIPTGAAMPDDITTRLASGAELGELALDDVFSGFGGAEMVWPQSRVAAKLECSASLGHVVVFSPRAAKGGMEPWFCVEPVSMVTDGFNLAASGAAGTGVLVVAPGGWARARMTLSLTHQE